MPFYNYNINRQPELTNINNENIILEKAKNERLDMVAFNYTDLVWYNDYKQ